MKVLFILSLLILAGCGTREFSLQKADGNEIGSVGVFRGIQTDEIILKEQGKSTRVFLCDWRSTLAHTRCLEAK